MGNPKAIQRLAKILDAGHGIALVLRGRLRPVSPQTKQVPLSYDEVEAFERIRAKLNVEGPEALTPKERAFLQQLRDRAIAGDR